MSERPHVDADELQSDVARREQAPDTDKEVPVDDNEAGDSLEVRFPDEEGNEHLESG